MRGKHRAAALRPRGKEHSFDEAVWKRNEGGLLEEAVRGIVRTCSMPRSRTKLDGAPVSAAATAQFPCMNCSHIVMDRELCPKCGTKTTAETAAILQLISKSSSSSVRNGLAVPLSDKACKVEMVIQNPGVAMALQEVVATDLDAEQAGQTAANTAYHAVTARAKAVDARKKAELLLVSLMAPKEAEGGKGRSTGSERRSSSSLLPDKENLLFRIPMRQRRSRAEGAGTNEMHNALAKKAVEIVLLKAKLTRMRSTAARAESRAGLFNGTDGADPAFKPAPAANGEAPSSPMAAGKAFSPPRGWPPSPSRPVPYDEATLSCSSPTDNHVGSAADFMRSLETSSAAHDESEEAPHEDGPLALLHRLNAVSSSSVPFDSEDEGDASGENGGFNNERIALEGVGTAAHGESDARTGALTTPDASASAASSVALLISSDVAELLSDECLARGVVLDDVAARKRIIVHSLAELRHGRAYNTLRGNCLRRTARCEALLGGRVALRIEPEAEPGAHVASGSSAHVVTGSSARVATGSSARVATGSSARVATAGAAVAEPVSRETAASARLQSAARGMLVRRVIWKQMERDRAEWIAYYIGQGKLNDARALGWDAAAVDAETDETGCVIA